MRSICFLLLLILIILPANAETTLTVAFESPKIAPTELKDKIRNDAELSIQYEIFNGLNQTFADLNYNVSYTLVISIVLLGNHTYCLDSIPHIVPGLNMITFQDDYTFSEIASEIAITTYADISQVSVVGNLLPTMLNLTQEGDTYSAIHSPTIPNNWTTEGSIQIRIATIQLVQNVEVIPLTKLRIEMKVDTYMPEQIEYAFLAGTFKVELNTEIAKIYQEEASYTIFPFPCNKKGILQFQKSFAVTFEYLKWSEEENLEMTITFETDQASNPINVLPYVLKYSYGEIIEENPPEIPQNLKTLQVLEREDKSCTTQNGLNAFDGITPPTFSKNIVTNAVIIAMIVTPITIIVIEQINKIRNRRIPIYESYPNSDELRKYY